MPRPAAALHSFEELRRKIKVLLSGLLLPQVISLAVFGSYFKATSGETSPKNIACRTRWWHSRQRLLRHQDG